MIKLIISDVDDTLVPEGSTQLNPEYFDVIRQLQAKGVRFLAASGRPIKAVKLAFAPIADEIFYVGDNGTAVEAGDCVYQGVFEDDLYRDLALDLQSLNDEYDFMSCVGGAVYVKKDTVHLNYLEGTYGFDVTKVDDMAEIKHIAKVSLHHEGGIPDDLQARMQEKWSDQMDVCIAGRVWLDFMTKGDNKGSAIARVQEFYGITPEETVAFGNADNDVYMLKKAKYAYAVAGASEGLKEAASEIIGAMEDDAVLAKLKEILEELE